MAETKRSKSLTVDRRREVFLALVEAQDSGAGVVESRDAIASQFGITSHQVRTIETEGLDRGWPPL